jgi:hypothetical protein
MSVVNPTHKSLFLLQSGRSSIAPTKTMVIAKPSWIANKRGLWVQLGNLSPKNSSCPFEAKRNLLRTLCRRALS